MRRGYTVFELVVAIIIMMIVAAISYPVIASAKRTANRTHCINNFRQIGVALAIYREQEGGTDQGLPWQMGLPPTFVELFPGSKGPPSALLCKGNNPNGNYYAFLWPQPHNREEQHRQWVDLVSIVGDAVVVVCDENHQPSFPRSRRWERWTAIGLQLDGAIRIETKLGFPGNSLWWLE